MFNRIPIDKLIKHAGSLEEETDEGILKLLQTRANRKVKDD